MPAARGNSQTHQLGLNGGANWVAAMRSNAIPIKRSIGSAARTKTHGKNKAAARRMRILHAVLFETARLRVKGSIEPHGEAMQKIAREENIQIETVERYCRVARKLMKSIRAQNFRL